MNAGALYQARVIASVYVAVIAQRPISWFGPVGRVPIAVWGETRGPGDDLRLEFDAGLDAEAQARHRMNAAGDLLTLVADIRSRSSETGPIPVALVVPRTASGTLFTNVLKDLDKFRGGRDDDLHAEVATLLTDLDNRSTLERLYVVPADFDDPHNADRANAIERLSHRLVDPNRVDAAFDVLVADAMDISAQAGRRDRPYLVTLLEGRGFALRPPERDERWVQELDWITDFLLEGRYDQAALDRLASLESELRRVEVSPRIRARAARLRTIALLRLERTREALNAADETLAYDPGWSEGLEVAARAALIGKELGVAAERAERAIAADERNAKAWAVKALVAAAEAAPLPTPPPTVADQRDYLLALLDIAGTNEDVDRIIELTASLIIDPHVRPEVRLIRGQALLYVGDRTDGAIARENWMAAEATLSGLIDALRVGHPLLASALVLRSHVRLRLDRTDEADRDLADAQRANNNDPAVIEQAAIVQGGRGHFDAALRILQAPIVDDVPLLLVIRADMLTALGRRAEARADLDRALAGLVAGEDNDLVIAHVARSALLLGDRDLAVASFGRMTATGAARAEGRMLAGDIAFLDGDVDRGTVLYREALSLSPDRRRPLLLNLGLQLLGANRPEDAKTTFEEAGIAEMSLVELEPYAVAAFRASNLAAAQGVIDRLASDGELPSWALRMAADIAMRRADPKGAASFLLALENQGEASARVHLALARCLVELGQEGAARDHTFAAAEADPTPPERANVAVFLKELGFAREALREAFRAYREDRAEPQIQRVLAILVFTAGVNIAIPDAVEADTHVRLREANGSTREHSIFAAPPINKAVGEMSLAEASSAGLLGMRVGELVERDTARWSRQRWTVEEIVPAVVHAARVIIATFSDTFPDQPSPFRTVSIGQGDKPSDWSTLIEALGARKQHAIEMLRMYHEKVLPLEFVTTILDISIPEFMRAAAQDPLVRPLFVEWSDAVSNEASARAATDAKSIILTRSGLATAESLGILDHLAAEYEVIVPTSLVWQLRIEIAAASKAVADGRSTIMLAGYGPHIEDVPAGDPRLLQALEAAEGSLSWLERSARTEPRPLGTMAPPGSRDELLRDQIGPPSFDALGLARAGIGTLFADDLGLRRLAIESRLPSISTIAVLDALVVKGRVTSAERDRHLVDLVLGGYEFIRPTSGLLEEALRRMPGLGREALRRAFAPLGGPLVTAPEAAMLAAHAIKAAATATIETAGVDVVADAAIRAMSIRWRQPLVARLVLVAAERELRLLPSRYLRTVTSVCTDLAAEGAGSI